MALLDHLVMRFFYIVGLLAILAIAVTTALPTSLFVRPESLSYFHYPSDRDDKEAYFVFRRVTPLGAVIADWSQEIRSPGLGQCHASAQDVPYEAAPNDTVSYTVPERLRPCIPESGQFTVDASRTVNLFGVIPLRRDATEWECSTEKPICTKP
jgi:hypothetical protein